MSAWMDKSRDELLADLPEVTQWGTEQSWWDSLILIADVESEPHDSGFGWVTAIGCDNENGPVCIVGRYDVAQFWSLTLNGQKQDYMLSMDILYPSGLMRFFATGQVSWNIGRIEIRK